MYLTLFAFMVREEARVTDVLIELTCLEGVTFDIDSAYRTSQMVSRWYVPIAALANISQCRKGICRVVLIR